MGKTIQKTGIKILKITGITVVAILLLMLVLPMLFPKKITEGVTKFANEKLEGELRFSEANLSFFSHFPSLTLQLTDFSLNGSAPYKNENLIKASEIAFGINLSSLIFNRTVSIDKIFVSNAVLNIKVNKKGEANYNVYVSDTTSVDKKSDETSMHLDKIIISDSHLMYNDQSLKMQFDAKGFNYTGKGDLDRAIFDLQTSASIDALDFTFENETYLKNKKVKAELVTKINTNSLSFIFEQNNLKINKLPVNFIGKFDFLKDGYNLDFEINSIDSELSDFFSALPPQYVTWLEKTAVEGSTDLSLTLKGKYIASSNTMPDLAFNMKIREGAINHNEAKLPMTNLFLNFDTKLPSLDPEKLKVNVDSVFFNVGKDYLKAIVKSTGLSNPVLDANVKASLDLQKMNRALGVQNIDIKGILNMDIISKGNFNKAKGLYPVTNGKIVLKNASLKTDYYPNPIENINLLAKISNTTGTARDMNIVINPASLSFEGKPFVMNASFKNLDDINYDIKAKGELDLAKIYKVFSQKGLDLEGFIKADVAFLGKLSDATNGNYDKLNNSGTMLLKNIKTTSEYFPKPFIIKEGLFKFNQDKMNFNNFVATYGESDFVMTGFLQNVINFALSDSAILKGNFDFTSNYINVDEFMSADSSTKNKAESIENTTSKTGATGVIIIPANLDLKLTAHAKKVNFNELILTDSKGNLNVNKGKLVLDNTSFNLIDCKLNMDVTYTSETSKRAFFDFKILAKDFDIKRAYNEVKMFREMATAAANAEGIVSLDYRVKGKLNEEMQPIYPSLTGGGVLSVKNVKMSGFKMFSAVSKKTNKEEMKNPDLSEVNINSSIKNNIITIERFKFKFAGFRPRIEGTSSFDGKLNIKMRLGLPPLGIIGIPMTITGTQDNPNVKLGKNTEDLEETEYVETVEVKQ